MVTSGHMERCIYLPTTSTMPKIFVHVVTFVVDSPHLYYAWNGVLLKQSEMKKREASRLLHIAMNTYTCSISLR
jgi:hypothetical protein